MSGYIWHTRTDEILDEGRHSADREHIEIMLRDGRTPEEIADFCEYPLRPDPRSQTEHSNDGMTLTWLILLKLQHQFPPSADSDILCRSLLFSHLRRDYVPISNL